MGWERSGKEGETRTQTRMGMLLGRTQTGTGMFSGMLSGRAEEGTGVPELHVMTPGGSR